MKRFSLLTKVLISPIVAAVGIAHAAASAKPDDSMTDILRDAVTLLLAARRQREGRPFLVGVNGIDKAGKTGFAAALARGCTSGQALSGGATLATGSWLFMLMVFAGGYAVAYFVRRQWI